MRQRDAEHALQAAAFRPADNSPSPAVYTQTTDVEVEVNGLMTYDRKVVKVEEERIREINRTICNSLNEQ